MKRNGLLKQRFAGICLILIGLVFLLIASTGSSLEDTDGTAAVLVIPLGVYLVFTKKAVMD